MAPRQSKLKQSVSPDLTVPTSHPPAVIPETAAAETDAALAATSPGSGGPGEALFISRDDAIAAGKVFLRVKAKVAGYRRGGLAHAADWVDHPLETLSSQQYSAITGDADLFVELS